MAKIQIGTGSAILLLVLLVGFGIWSGIIPFDTSKLPQWGKTATVTQTAPPVTGVVPKGDFDSLVSVIDSFVSTSTYTATSSGVAFTFYAKLKDGTYKYLATGDAAIVSITEDYGGYIYVVCENAAAYQIDWKKTDDEQGRVVGVEFFDIDADNTNEFVFKYSLWDIPRESGYRPKIPVTCFAWTYEAPTMTDVSNVANTVGTSSIEKTIEWYTTQATTNRAWILTKIEITIKGPGPTYTPASDVSKFEWVKIDLPDDGKGYIDISGSLAIRDSDLYYYYTIGTNPYTGLPIKTASTDTNRKNFYTKVKFHFASGDGDYALTLRIYRIVPAAGGEYSTTSATDSVLYSD